MNFFLDISLIALIIATVAICWHKGFIRSIVGVGKTVACILMTYLFGSSASAWVSKLWITERVTDFVHTRLVALFEAGAETFDPAVILNNVPSWIQTFFEGLGIDVAGLISGITDMSALDAQGLQTLAQSMAKPITHLISDFIGYTGVYLISLILFSIAAYFLVKIADLPIIRTIDRALGCVLGICSSLVYASVFTLLVFALFSLIEGYNPEFAFHAAYDKTWVFRVFYRINIFRWIFGIG